MSENLLILKLKLDIKFSNSPIQDFRFLSKWIVSTLFTHVFSCNFSTNQNNVNWNKFCWSMKHVV